MKQVKCIDNMYFEHNLALGKVYDVIEEEGVFYRVKNDNGIQEWYAKLRFEKTLKYTASESTCQKRQTICDIYDEQGVLLSRESNRCNPTGGTCHRIGVVQQKDTSSCNWVHAEINAIYKLPNKSKPYRALLYGHSFYCDACETALKKAGVVVLEKYENNR